MWILILFLMLIICSISDVKTRYINTIVIWIALISAVVVAFIAAIISNLDIRNIVTHSLCGIFPGTIILVISRMKTGIGEGDAFVIMATGFLSGLQITIYSLFVAFLFSGLYGVIKINCKDTTKNKSFPFVPFITLGYAICICFITLKKTEVWL